MPLSAAKRAWIAIGALICLAAAAACIYLYRVRRPLAPPSVGLTPELLSLLPADAPVIGFADVAALRRLPNSLLSAALGLTQTGPRGDRDYLVFVRDTGFDYTRDLDAAAIAYWPADFTTPSRSAGENRYLVIANGRFDRQKIQAYALHSGGTATRDAQEAYTIPGDPQVSFQFLSPTRIVLASGKDSELLVRRARPGPLDPAIQARIARVAGAPVFAVARTDDLPSSFYANFQNAPQFVALLRNIRGLTLAGQPTAAGDLIKLSLDAECDSMKSALEISAVLDALRMAGTIALSDPKTRHQMSREQAAYLASLVRDVKISPQNRWVRLNLDVTPQMLGAAPAAHP
jgi:hypothetical protein